MTTKYEGQYTLRADGKLKNGATLIEQRGDIVLAKSNGFHPYVTWTMDAHGNCHSGHYHKDLTKAVEEFDERTGRKAA